MSLDRRSKRRLETIDEIVAVSLTQMAQLGAGGLSLGAVARAMGIQTPSLYSYFPSKAALYDEVFRRGWESYGLLSAGIKVCDVTDPTALLARALTESVQWASAHRPYAELMFWRPIPAWEPSPRSYAAAAAVLDQLADVVTALQTHGLLDPHRSVEEVVQVLAAIVTGIVSQHLSNNPDAPVEQGLASRHIDAMAAMFVGHYGGPLRGTAEPTQSEPTQ